MARVEDGDYYQLYNQESPRRGYAQPYGRRDDYERRDPLGYNRPADPRDAYGPRDGGYRQQDYGRPGDYRNQPEPGRSQSRFNDPPAAHPIDNGPSRSQSKAERGYNAAEWQTMERSTQYKVDGILKKFQTACLKRGTAGIKSFGRVFRQYDDDGNKKLNQAEFRKGVREYGLNASDGITDHDIDQLFTYFDRDNSGCINFDELLQGIRPPMNEARRRLIARAFDKLDATGDGVVTVADLIHPENGYDVTQHPKYKSGELSQKEIMLKFLENFEAPTSKDGLVTREEFLNYYAGVSASIEKDVYFDLMMRQSWRLDKPPTYVGKRSVMMQY